MQLLVKQFKVWVMLLSLLVATTGFRLVKHSCPSCDIVEITFLGTNPCCSSEQVPPEPQPFICCSLTLEHLHCTGSLVSDTCCLIQSVLLRVDDLVSPNKHKVHPQTVEIPPVPLWSNQIAELPETRLASVNKHPPPIVFSGTEYLIFIQQIKIPC
jgi:hypothetical protein